MRPGKKTTSSIRCLAVVGCLMLGVVLFSVISIANAPAPLDELCSDGDENSDLTCNSGMDYDFIEIPDVQQYNTLGAALLDPKRPLYKGVSLAGGEFGGPLAARGDFLPYDNDAVLFIYKGMNTFRLPIAWEYFADINGGINAAATYLARLDSVIVNLLSKKATILIEVHNYMRYNPANVDLNVNHRDPNGADVIGVGNAAPTTEAFATLWSNIVGRYNAPGMIYGLMNEPHDISFSTLVRNTNAALQSIRLKEASLGIGERPHLVLVSGNNYTGLHSWFSDDGFCNGNNALFLDRLVDPARHYAIEVHQYFDEDSSGTYPAGDCLPSAEFNRRFDTYWPRFANWSSTNTVMVVLGEFGAPNTTTCIQDVSHLMDAFTTFEGSLGWYLWAAGNSWGDYVISAAPGGRANPLMWGNTLYEKYLTALNQSLPPLRRERIAMRIINNSTARLSFQGGYLPPQLQGSADIEARGGIGFFYSNNNDSTPTGGLNIKYYVSDKSDPLGFGFEPPNAAGTSYGYAFNNSRGNVTVHADPVCDITPTGPAANRGEVRCYIVVNK